jgi:hypothetical protein
MLMADFCPAVSAVVSKTVPIGKKEPRTEFTVTADNSISQFKGRIRCSEAYQQSGSHELLTGSY